MLQIYDMGPTALLLLRRKAYWGFFRPKNPIASAGFEPANLGTKGQHATARPPKPISAHIAQNLLWHFFPRIPLTRILHCPRSCCHGQLEDAGPVTNVLLTALKATDPVSNRANTFSITTTRISQTFMNFYQTGAFHSVKFSQHSLA